MLKFLLTHKINTQQEEDDKRGCTCTYSNGLMYTTSTH